jgi:hypothetical protein
MVVHDEQLYFSDARLVNRAKNASYSFNKDIVKATKLIEEGFKWPEEKISGKRNRFVRQDPELDEAAKAELIKKATDDIKMNPPPRTPAQILNWFMAKCIENHTTRLSVAVSSADCCGYEVSLVISFSSSILA